MSWKQAIFIIIVLASAYLLSFILRRLLNLYIKKSSGLLKADPTNFSFLKNSISFVIAVIAFILIFLSIPTLSNFGKAMFAGAGVFAAIIGFASQKAFSNIISGLFILIFKPFHVGDVIELESASKGYVEEITLRHTIIRDYENRRIIIPNTIISEQAIINSNITDTRVKKHIVIGISYDSDIDLAKSIIADEIINHPFYIDVRSPEQIEKDTPKVQVKVIALADFSINIKAWAWAENNDNGFLLSCDVLESIKKRFDREGIEIPFPYRTVVYKKDLPDNAGADPIS